jgi:hypothetical protein
LIEVEKEQKYKPPCIFRYEIMWEREDSLQVEIKEAWNSAGHVRHLGDDAATLSTVRSSLRK